MRDGRINQCKKCSNATHAKHYLLMYKTNPEWVAKRRSRCRKNTAEYYKRHGIVETGSATAKLKYKLKNPDREWARYTANNALKRGEILRSESCNRCGAIGVDLEKHHDDYSKPLAIEWLCIKCHGKTRRKDGFNSP